MPLSRWIIAVALGLIVATSGQAQEQAQPGEGQPDEQQEPASSYPLPFPVEIVEDEAAADARQRSEEEARQREIEDLAAQQGMNDATRAMNAATQDMRDYALYSTILVGVGTVLLFVTLFLTWQANKAARDAVEVTREIGEAQVRAYPIFQIKEVLISNTDEFGNVVVSFRGKVKNTGTTPAYGLGFRIEITKVSGQAHGETNADGLGMFDTGTSLSTLAAEQEVNQKLERRMEADIEKVRSGQEGFRLTYVLTYIDVFGKKQTSPIVSGTTGIDQDAGKIIFMPDILTGHDEEED